MLEKTCNHEWRAPRQMISTEGKAFETTPVNHICELAVDHQTKHHMCSCGDTETVDE